MQRRDDCSIRLNNWQRIRLTTQMPMHAVYWTSGCSRNLTLGKYVMQLQHDPSWQFAFANERVGATSTIKPCCLRCFIACLQSFAADRDHYSAQHDIFETSLVKERATILRASAMVG